MKKIESRIISLENQQPKDNFLVVLANKNESRDDAISRVMNENGITALEPETFIIYMNLHAE